MLNSSCDSVVDVVIVGAGTAGVALAIGLKNLGHEVLLIERTPHAGPIFKGEFLQPRAVQIANSVGLGSIFQGPKVNKIKSLRFRDLAEDDDHVMGESTLTYSGDHHAVTITHFELCTRLRQAARDALKENFIENASVLSCEESFNRIDVKVKTTSGIRNVECRWLVGCDGKNSQVRKLIGGTSPSKNSASVPGVAAEFIVGAEIQASPKNITQYEVIRTFGRGTLSFFALEKGQRVYWSTPATAREDGKKFWETELNSLFTKSSTISAQGPLSTRVLNGAPAGTEWFGPSNRGRILLVGDALAVTTPFGGQGITCALTHVRMLLENFDFRSNSSARIISQLSHYESEAKKVFSRINTINLALYYLFLQRKPMFKLSTQYVFESWAADPELPRRVIDLFGGIDEDQLGAVEFLKLCGIMKPELAPKVLRRVGAGPLKNPLKWLDI